MSTSIKTNSRPGSISKEEAKIKMTLDLRNGIDEIERIVRQDARLEVAERLRSIMLHPNFIAKLIEELEHGE